MSSARLSRAKRSFAFLLSFFIDEGFVIMGTEEVFFASFNISFPVSLKARTRRYGISNEDREPSMSRKALRKILRIRE